jgi:hypothetical protein
MRYILIATFYSLAALPEAADAIKSGQIFNISPFLHFPESSLPYLCRPK